MTFDEIIEKYKLSKEMVLAHLETLQNSFDRNVSYVWSGDLRSPFLHRTVCIGQDAGILDTAFVDNEAAQESGYNITWPDNSQQIMSDFKAQAEAL